MSKKLTAVFDGNVFHPETPLELEANARYVLTIEAEQKKNIWDLLEPMIGTIEAPSDWAGEHDHYLHGTPKRTDKSANE
ncbi:MAG: hypothetical protein RLZZ568_2326 [Cyanobacteriota bacterium]|jgi:hypothetical protein